MLTKEILPGNRIDTTNGFLDVSWRKDHREIGSESNEHTDSEISLVLCSTFAIFSLPKSTLNSQCTGITLRAEGLYESFL